MPMYFRGRRAGGMGRSGAGAGGGGASALAGGMAVDGFVADGSAMSVFFTSQSLCGEMGLQDGSKVIRIFATFFRSFFWRKHSAKIEAWRATHQS